MEDKKQNPWYRKRLPKQIEKAIFMCGCFWGLMTICNMAVLLDTGPTASLPGDIATVKCKWGFMYNTSHNITWRTVVALEKLAKETCKSSDYNKRLTFEWRYPNGKPKHAKYSPSESKCIIDWELHPATHEMAVMEGCKPQDFATTWREGIVLDPDGVRD